MGSTLIHILTVNLLSHVPAALYCVHKTLNPLLLFLPPINSQLQFDCLQSANLRVLRCSRYPQILINGHQIGLGSANKSNVLREIKQESSLDGRWTRAEAAAWI